MSGAFYTTGPYWPWLIVTYCFVGGIAGGSFFLAALLDLFGTSRDRPTARAGYYVAFVGVILSAVLLPLDLERSERLWPMLIQSERSMPMPVGFWMLLLFGGFACVASLGALHEAGWLQWAPLQTLHHGILKPPLTILGGLLGFFIAGDTRVLLSVTNRPLGVDTHWLGLLFLFSGASTAVALLMFLGLQRSVRSVDTAH
ncbi:MAG TPA: NrfD/PsrC family molybdoenzyme membrane anchor subunit [Candidatus Tectomicrobia bacterium]